MADLQAARAAKRARTDAPTTSQFAGPPRPSIEDVEDEDLPRRSNNHAHHASNSQPSVQKLASNAAGAQITTAPGRVVKNPQQGARSGKYKS